MSGLLLLWASFTPAGCARNDELEDNDENDKMNDAPEDMRINGGFKMKRFISAALAFIFACHALIIAAFFDLEVETVAGTGSHGFWDGGIAQFNLPFALCGDGEGGFYVADTFNNMLRHVSADGEVRLAAGSVEHFGGDSFPQAAYIDGFLHEAAFGRPQGVLYANGRLYIADSLNHAVRVIIGEEVFTFAGGLGEGFRDGGWHQAMFSYPSALALHPDGSIYVADTGNHSIRRIAADGSVSTVIGNGRQGFRDGPAREAMFDGPMGLAISPDGMLYIVDTGNHVIRVIEDGTVRTLAGTPREYGFADGSHGQAMFNQPIGIAPWGRYLVVADSCNHSIRIIGPDGNTMTLAGTGEPGYVAGDARSAEFHFPMGVFVEGGLLLVADSGNNMIRAIDLADWGEKE